MESLNPELPLYGSKNLCTRTKIVLPPITEVSTVAVFLMPNKSRDKGGLCRQGARQAGRSREKASIKWDKAGTSRGRKGKGGRRKIQHGRENSGKSKCRNGEER